MALFFINSPCGKKQQIIYTNGSNEKERCAIVQKQSLNYWSEYCFDNWICFDTTDPNKMSREDLVKSFLSRCGTFILKSSAKKHGLISETKHQKNKVREVLQSTARGNVSNIFYSSGSDMEDHGFNKKTDFEKEAPMPIDFINNAFKNLHRSYKKRESNQSKFAQLRDKENLEFTWCQLNQDDTFIYKNTSYTAKQVHKSMDRVLIKAEYEKVLIPFQVGKHTINKPEKAIKEDTIRCYDESLKELVFERND